jgi:hypothetical protein
VVAGILAYGKKKILKMVMVDGIEEEEEEEIVVLVKNKTETMIMAVKRNKLMVSSTID